MKKFSLLFLIAMLFCRPAMAAYEQYYPKPETKNAFQVMARGVANLVGMPAEVGATMVREAHMHPKLCVVTYWPRMTLNLFTRAASGVNDSLLFPWVVPFADDTSPWTQGMGIPEYPWKVA